MDSYTFIIEIIKAISWPVLIIILVAILRKPLSNLIPFLQLFKYKDLEIQFFSKKLHQVKLEADKEIKKPSIEEKPIHLIENKNLPSRTVILEAWLKLEEVAFKKYQQLYSNNATRLRHLTSHNALHEFEFGDLLIPSAKRLLRELRDLRNKAVHFSDFSISKEDAEVYLSLATQLYKQIDAISETPKIKITALLGIVNELIHLIDTGKYNDISFGEIYEAIQKRNVLAFLKNRTQDDIDLSIYLETNTYSGFNDFYHDNLESIHNAYSGNEKRKWGIEKSGLCILLAWTILIIKMGSGWHPEI